MSQYIVAVDIGGTFSDLVCLDTESGEIRNAKVPSTPPTFMGVSKQDTGVNPQNSVVFDNALKAASVPEELHLYTDGAHGTGIRKATGDMAAWPAQAAAWLAKMKLTTTAP